jgi:hypothetical protein
VWIGETRVTITDPERTLLDGLNMPRYRGDFAEVLHAFEARGTDLELQRIIEYALKLDAATAKRLGWVLERHGVDFSKLKRSIGPREVDNEDGRVDAPDPSKRKATASRRPLPGSTRSTIRRETGNDARRLFLEGFEEFASGYSRLIQDGAEGGTLDLSMMGNGQRSASPVGVFPLHRDMTAFPDQAKTEAFQRANDSPYWNVHGKPRHYTEIPASAIKASSMGGSISTASGPNVSM